MYGSNFGWCLILTSLLLEILGINESSVWVGKVRDSGIRPWLSSQMSSLFLVSACFYCSPCKELFCFSASLRLLQELLCTGLSLSGVSVHLLSVLIHHPVVGGPQGVNYLCHGIKHKNLFEILMSSIVKWNTT